MPLGAVVHAESAVGGAYRGGARELGDGNVIRMSVRSLRTEGHDHIGLNSPNVRDDGANGSSGLDLIKGAVRVVQDGDLANSEHRRGGSQFLFPNAADFNRIASLSE